MDASTTLARNVPPASGAVAEHPHADRVESKPVPRLILRFHKSERMLHWSIAIPFMVCFVTALVLVLVYNLHPQRPYRIIFATIHRIAGVCLIMLPLLTALRHHRDHKIHVYNIKQAWIWAIDDVKWLMLMGIAAINSKISLPDQGKFNAAEKLNFMMVMSTYPLFIATGLLIWILRLAFWPWMVHMGMAAIAAPLMLGHIFMATTNPSTRVGLSGMISGYVDRHWAKHHYTRWYREHFEKDAKPAHQENRPPARQRPLVQRPSEASGD
jgi:formate dehydrogenase subunit gamma